MTKCQKKPTLSRALPHHRGASRKKNLFFRQTSNWLCIPSQNFALRDTPSIIPPTSSPVGSFTSNTYICPGAGDRSKKIQNQEIVFAKSSPSRRFIYTCAFRLTCKLSIDLFIVIELSSPEHKFSRPHYTNVPILPTRPVRPIRCTYSSQSLGKSKLMTCFTFGISKPRAATCNGLRY